METNSDPNHGFRCAECQTVVNAAFEGIGVITLRDGRSLNVFCDLTCLYTHIRSIDAAFGPATVGAQLARRCDSIKRLLLEKNTRYGNSALQPLRLFSKATPIEGLLVRIDDKLSRLREVGIDPAADEDTLIDLIGYLILLLEAR